MKVEIDEKAARKILMFFGSLRHTKGRWAKQPFKLQKWQADLHIEVFGRLMKNGKRLVKKVYCEIPKKNGKSEMASGDALYLTTADGEYGAEVYGAATEKKQAGIVYRAAKAMVAMVPDLSEHCDVIDSAKRIYYPEGDSYYEVLSSEAYSKGGYNIHGRVIDELSALESRELYDVLTDGSGAAREQPLFIDITNAGSDQHSVCWEVRQYALRTLKFRFPKRYEWVQGEPIDDPTFYAVIYGLREDEDWADERNWYKANPALGSILNIEDMRNEFKVAQQSLVKELNFKRLRLGMWIKSNIRWMRMPQWDACAGINDLELLKGRDCYAGLDLSSSIDMTALALVFPWDDNTYDILLWYWAPRETIEERERLDKVPYRQWAKDGYLELTPGEVVDYDYIDLRLEELQKLFHIKELAYDPWNSFQFAQQLLKKGFVIDPKEADSGHPLLVEFRQGFKSMSGPTKDMMKSVLLKQIRHGGNPILRWNADNAVANVDPAENIKLDKAKSEMRIDGMIAAIMGLGRAMVHQPEEKKSIYEERGPLIF
jgi:phage terminase large subunit-like protein